MASTGYEIKFDGYRCLAGRDSTGMTLWSRRANRLTGQLPTDSPASVDDHIEGIEQDLA
jgi:ATP-dependent DNA ligase